MVAVFCALVFKVGGFSRSVVRVLWLWVLLSSMPVEFWRLLYKCWGRGIGWVLSMVRGVCIKVSIGVPGSASCFTKALPAPFSSSLRMRYGSRVS